jgi:hypothetical protein
MNAAKLDKSERLQRVDALLSDGREYSTQDIIDMAFVSAVSASISELRKNGRTITCRRVKDIWLYRREFN